MNTLQICENLINVEINYKIGSVVRGNKNWSIRTEIVDEEKIAFVGRHGIMLRKGCLSCWVKDIGKYHIRFYDYTYKVDFNKAIEVLEKMGYFINWVT